MAKRKLRLRPLAVPVVAAWLLASAGAPQAGMLAMTDSVADFAFEDGEVVYDLSLPDSTLLLTADNGVQLTGADSDAAGAQNPAAASGLSLELRAGISGGKLFGGQFNIFGSLNPASASPVVELVSGTLDAMKLGESEGTFAFLFVGKGTTGELAQQYRSIGIYTSVAGIAEEDWARDFDSSASLMNLIARGDLVGAGGTQPMPVPATALLLGGGLLLVGLTRRMRRQRDLSDA